MSDLQPSQQEPSRKPGTWAPGQSGNPGGRPKGLEALARAHTAAAINALVAALENERERVPAAIALLDRGWGRPKQTLVGDVENPLQFVIRGPNPVESVDDWLRQHAPPLIEGETSE